MTHESPRWILIVLAAWLFSATVRAQSLEQATEGVPSAPLQRRCRTVALSSADPGLPLRLFVPYLERRADFQDSKLVLTEDSNAADVVVHLTQSDEQNVNILAFNRITGQSASTVSNWTEYPGMVALNVINQLRLICPGSIVASPEQQVPTPKCLQPSTGLRSVTTIAACSRTSWMNSSEIYKGLERHRELKELSIGVEHGCESNDAVLNVTHNLDVTVEWFWTLRDHAGNTLLSDRVIAFDRRDAASKIAAALIQQIALPHGADAYAPIDRVAAENEKSPTHVVGVLLIPTDFSVPDTRTVLSVDGEQVIARDVNNRVIFNLKRGEIRDVHLGTEWSRSSQWSDPTPLAVRSAQDLAILPADIRIDPAVDPIVHRSGLCRLESVVEAAFSGYGPIPKDFNFCPALDLSKLIGYLTAGTVLAQIPSRAEILEIAWEKYGVVKTIAMEVPQDESELLLHALQGTASTGELQPCKSETAAVAISH